MTSQTLEIKLSPQEASDEQIIASRLKKESRWPSGADFFYRILRKSIDARRVPVMFILRCEIDSKPFLIEPVTRYPEPVNRGEAVIVGFGPAGMFAALELLKQGIKPIVLERGKPVRERRRDLANLMKDRSVNPESNYCFGEGGAGTFSDGKLYTRSKKRGDIQSVLQTLVEHGADPSILYEAHPHIGTNRLPAIVEAIRETIIRLGGEIRFECKLTDIHVESGRIVSVETTHGLIKTDRLILATGHSAHDIFNLLAQNKIGIEAKPFALGVRIEHDQKWVDSIQYKCESRGEFLPPASYSLVHQSNGRGVFSFCMCPGGIIAPSMTNVGEVVVNGWSPSKRNGQFANSGFVVQVLPDDWKSIEGDPALGALRYQQRIERKAFIAGGSNLSAPAQRASDFVQRRWSRDLPESSYIPGMVSSDLHDVLPMEISVGIAEALRFFNKRMRGFADHRAILVGVESRTSSPVKIPRDRESLSHPEVEGLYPCGEGAGYAGGIMSAALDGISCARAIALKINVNQLK
ncbi:MAG: FAD-binding protein [Bacteroidetes bacterium]|nr:FAD-binding protein [Bacteroidota bacterium]